MKKIRNAVSLIIRNKEGKIFVVRRSPNKESFPGYLSLPSVYLDGNESFQDAANRLARKKLGLGGVIISSTAVGISEIAERKDALLQMYDFNVVSFDGALSVNPKEYTESLWLAPLEFRDTVASEHGGEMGECTRTFLKSQIACK